LTYQFPAFLTEMRNAKRIHVHIRKRTDMFVEMKQKVVDLQNLVQHVLKIFWLLSFS